MNVYQVGPNEFTITWNRDSVSGTATLQFSDHDHEGWVDGADVTGESSWTLEPFWVWSDVDEVGDPGVIRNSRHRTWYFRIVHDGGVLGPVFVNGRPDGVALEVARLAVRHLQRDIQTKAWLIRKPTYGERCPSCWDVVRNERVRTKCSTCDSSGYVRGWGTAIPIYASFAIDKPQTEQLNTMRFNQLQLAIWTSNKPIIGVGDYLLRAQDLELFEVVRWQPTLRRGFMIRQNVMGRLLEKNDSLYSIVAEIVAG